MSVAKLAAICAFALTVTGTRADASIIHVTHTGSVLAGVDNDGLFAPVGTELKGLEYSVVYTFDTSLNTPYSEDYPTTLGYCCDQGSASLTIGGQTLTFGVKGGLYHKIFNPEVYPFGVEVYEVAWEDSTHYSVFNRVTSPNNFLGSIDFAHPFFYTLGDLDHEPEATDAEFATNLSTILFWDETISSDGGVPEPASWAMMVGGFGLVGGALRGRGKPAVRFA